LNKKILSIALASMVSLSSISIAYAEYDFSNQIYKKNMRHEDVKVIQKALIKENLLKVKNPTTYYGNLTKSGIKNFQRKYGLKADGIAGKNTLGKMETLGLLPDSNQASSQNTVSINLYRLGDRNKDVSVIQQALKKSGFYTFNKITDYYGPITEKAVKDFQRYHGLVADGIVGPKTIAKLPSLNLLDNKSTMASRNDVSRSKYGEYLDWWKEAQYLVPRGAKFEVIDYYTGKSFMAQRSVGTNHADVETLTAKDTEIMKDIWGGSFNWERRPVIILINGRRIAASAAGMPHAGNDKVNGGSYSSWRSGDYSGGTNLDYVKENDMHGVFDLHFLNSKRHMDGKIDNVHQQAIKVSAGINK